LEPDATAWAGLPPPLLALLEAERAAGNRVLSVEYGFPAPPAGFCVQLERPVSTRPEQARDGLEYRQWPNWKGAHGYTDAKGHHFLLNPPLPPPSDPVMRWDEPAGVSRATAPPLPQDIPPPGEADAASPLERFRASLNIDYEKWHEGIGYDLDALEALDRDARQAAERLILDRNAQDWRDVEALAHLNTVSTRAMLRQAAEEGTAAIRLAVLHYAPDLLPPEDRTRTLVAALATTAPFDGLGLAVAAVVAHHPPPVMEALWRGLIERDGGVAVHFAALLTYLYGQAASTFDWAHRPFFLTFNTEDADERATAVAVLRKRLGLD
jgi:hypothetical protein